jgi:site-specific DNA-methyltransferase (adenine-specific)
MELYIIKVAHADALQLLRVLPTASIDAVLTDAMYGTSKDCQYDWGVDPDRGAPVRPRNQIASHMELYIIKVAHADALQLLRVLPTASIDAVVTDAMYGTSKDCRYDWGVDPARGDPVKHWLYHQPIYEECLRVLKPGGALAWGQSAEFERYYDHWFKGHRKWALLRHVGQRVSGHLWVVQTREQRPIELTRGGVIECTPMGSLKKLHPCIKPVEESAFLIEALTKPGDVVLDCFCGLGSMLLAAQALGRRWIGCDISRRYCQVCMARLQGRNPAGGQPVRVALWAEQRMSVPASSAAAETEAGAKGESAEQPAPVESEDQPETNGQPEPDGQEVTRHKLERTPDGVTLTFFGLGRRPVRDPVPLSPDLGVSLGFELLRTLGVTPPASLPSAEG